MIHWLYFLIFSTKILHHFLPYKYILFYDLEYIIIAALKSLSYNFNIWVILGLTSICCFPLKMGHVFLVGFFWSNNLKLNPEYCEC